MRINFKQFKTYTELGSDNFLLVDVRKAVGQMIYNNGTGLPALALATKIYNSNGETDFDEEEIKLLKEIAGRVGTPLIINSLNKI